MALVVGAAVVLIGGAVFAVTKLTDDGSPSSGPTSSPTSSGGSSASGAKGAGGTGDSPATSTAAGQSETLAKQVQPATIRIVARGSYADLGQDVTEGTWSGSGFFIDPSGLAVTNNHVVTGASTLDVYVNGATEPVNARVLGVSECADLAVIKVDGSDFAALPLQTAKPAVGTDVWSAGFPLGDTEFTWHHGNVSKADASGDTDWASVSHVIEHDALINPGSSGGPLVNAQGEVVGVNYAGNDKTRQAFAIGMDEAQGIIEQLQAGTDVASTGLAGQAYVSDDGSISGVWVQSVKSGSPADVAGVQAGDLITSMENITVVSDGTLQDYCKILREHGPDDQLALQVVRPSTQQILEGRLNGEPLKATEQAPATTEAPPATERGRRRPERLRRLRRRLGQADLRGADGVGVQRQQHQGRARRPVGGPEPPSLDRHLVGDRRGRVRPRRSGHRPDHAARRRVGELPVQGRPAGLHQPRVHGQEPAVVPVRWAGQLLERDRPGPRGRAVARRAGHLHVGRRPGSGQPRDRHLHLHGVGASAAAPDGARPTGKCAKNAPQMARSAHTSAAATGGRPASTSWRPAEP